MGSRSISARRSAQHWVGILRKTLTMAGSNWVPQQRTISLWAAAKLSAFAVGAVGGHGVEGVGDGEDARAEGDVLAARPRG